MATRAICIHCGHYILFPDPNVTIDNQTICPKCLKRDFRKAAALLRAYNRRNHTNQPVTLSFTQALTRRPPSRSD